MMANPAMAAIDALVTKGFELPQTVVYWFGVRAEGRGVEQVADARPGKTFHHVARQTLADLSEEASPWDVAI